MRNIVRTIGSWFLSTLRGMGHMFIFLMHSIYFIFIPPFKFNLLLKQIRFIGTKSMVVILLMGSFTGMVLALQIFHTLRKVGSEAMLGPAVALSLIRELGPVLCALTITGRAGSALTAEIGIMRITEQIDALISMALNPIRYLIVPTIVASIIVFPLLTAIFDVIGIYGGYFVGVKLLGLSSGTYFSQMEQFVDMLDIRIGIYKSVSFGLIVSWVCCYKGFYTGYGAEGVSKATTEAVVMSSVMILIWDYFLGSILL
ncbi:MAG: MlaE family lipid ABC transporter permease subunit [Nitrospirota bacterium]|nr:MlaE family lipid ABC transporter permease subunit [Nitrospirota bacterium]MDH5767642.1 MlaE family lipid ABC transporter permease subunit [Nitrospirota bacterium]